MFRILELNKSEVGVHFLVSSLSGSLRKHPVFSAQVSTGETRNLSRKNRMLSQVIFPGSPTDFLRLITPPPSPLPLPSAPLLKTIALLKFQFDLVGDEETGTLFCDHGTIIIN